MGIRLAIALVAVSVLCLFSAPIYEATSFKGKLPADVRDRASMLPVGREVTDTLEGPHWYHAVRVGANQRLRVDLTSSVFDPYLAMFRISADSLDQVAYDDDGGEGTNARLEQCIDSTGTYLFRVTAFGSSNRTGAYQIRATAEPADCVAMREAERQRLQDEQARLAMDADRRREEARTMYRQGRTVALGQTVEGSLGTSSTRGADGKPFESWDLSCTAGQALQMDVEGQGFDAYARIYNGDGSEVASNDDGGGNLHARIEYTCPVDGTYYLVATSFTSGAVGRYIMRVSRR